MLTQPKYLGANFAKAFLARNKLLRIPPTTFHKIIMRHVFFVSLGKMTYVRESVQKLASIVNKSVRTIQRHLKRASSLGLLIKGARGYYLGENLLEYFALNRGDIAQESDRKMPPELATLCDDFDGQCRTRVARVSQDVAKNSSKLPTTTALPLSDPCPNNEYIIKAFKSFKSLKKEDVKFCKETEQHCLFESEEKSLPSWLPKNEWDKFVEAERQCKSPVTPVRKECLIKSLNEIRDLGFDITQVIIKAIESGYHRFAAPKGRNSKTQPSFTVTTPKLPQNRDYVPAKINPVVQTPAYEKFREEMKKRHLNHSPIQPLLESSGYATT